MPPLKSKWATSDDDESDCEEVAFSKPNGKHPETTHPIPKQPLQSATHPIPKQPLQSATHPIPKQPLQSATHPIPKQPLQSATHPIPKQPLQSATPLPHVEEIAATQKLKSRWAVDDDDGEPAPLDPIHKKTGGHGKGHPRKGRKKSEQTGQKDLTHLSIPTGPASLRRDAGSQASAQASLEEEVDEDENKHFSKAALAFRNRLMLSPATTDIPHNPEEEDDKSKKKKQKARVQPGPGTDARPSSKDTHPSSKDAHPSSKDTHPSSKDAHPSSKNAHPLPDKSPACPSEPSKWEKEREARRLHKAKEARGLEWNQRRHDKLRPEGPDVWRKDAVPTQPASLKRATASTTTRPEHGVSNPESKKNGPDLSKDPVKTFEDIMREAEDDDGDWADEV